MEYTKVKDKNHLYRDDYSNGIVNTDSEGYNNYIKEYMNRYNQIKKIQNLEDEVKSIHDDLQEIKNLLRSLANGS